MARRRQHWEPQNIVEFFGEESLLTIPIGLNAQAGVASCAWPRGAPASAGVILRRSKRLRTSFLLYFDTSRHCPVHRFNDWHVEDLAEAIVAREQPGSQGKTVPGLWLINQLVLTDVGVLDAHNQFRYLRSSVPT